MAQKHILIICGEASGDLNAANLASAIKQINPSIRISAVGGELLRKEGAEIYHDIKNLAVIGFFDALKKLPHFLALKKLILQKIKDEKPDAVILVDFSGFNLRLAKEINRSLPVIYYISPQVWASRPGRLKTIKEYILKMIVIFKFEEEFYKKYGIAADFAGHPLLDIVKPTADKEDFLKKNGLCQSKTTIALLPGSRKQEIEKILPVMLRASSLICGQMEAQFVIAKSSQVGWDIYNRFMRNFNLNVKIIEGRTYDCLGASDFALVASGTATLETAIMQKPFCIVYKMGLLNYLLYRPLVKVPFIGMVNIVAGRKIIPEFIQFQATPKRIADEALKIMHNPEEISRIKNELSSIKSRLGEKGASLRAAQIILNAI